MANVLLTTNCNLSCKYCFAQEKMVNSPKQIMSMENVSKVIEFFKRSNYPIFRVMGGEPTLHPHFPEIIRLALSENMRVDILSNATWGGNCNDLFTSIAPNYVLFLLNIDHPDYYSFKQWNRIQHNLEVVARRHNVTLSFNIFEQKPRYEYILDLVRQFGIRTIRLSFALPVLGARNACLDVTEYRGLAPFVLEFVRQAHSLGSRVQLDNAIPLCMFTYEQAGELLLQGVLDLERNTRCEPVIDIGPDLTVWCCFCLSKLQNRHLDEFTNLHEICEYYQGVLGQYQGRVFPMDECDKCQYRDSWGCQGGCITYSIRKHGQKTVKETVPRTEELIHQTEQHTHAGDEIVISHYKLPKECYVLTHTQSGIQIEFDASSDLFHGFFDGIQPLPNVVEKTLTSEEIGIQNPVDVFIRSTLENSLRDLIHDAIKQR